MPGLVAPGRSRNRGDPAMPAERAAQHIVEDAPAADRPRLLEHHAEHHARIRERTPGQRGDVAPHHADMSGGRTQQAGDAFRRRGFPQPFWPRMTSNSPGESEKLAPSRASFSPSVRVTHAEAIGLDQRGAHDQLSLLRSICSTFTRSRIGSKAPSVWGTTFTPLIPMILRSFSGKSLRSSV